MTEIAGVSARAPERAFSAASWSFAALQRAAVGTLVAVAVVSCLGAFAGLAASGWWTDELFTLFVIDHRGGFPEVLRRALTDTQPPGYYLLLYAWSQVSGLGEAALRSLSAVLAVAAVGVFCWTTRRLFSTGARAWAAAVAVTSPFWFVQSQNIRNYSLSIVLAAAIIALALRIRREARAGRAEPWASWAALTAVGALDAATHFYGLLGFGAWVAVLIVTVPSWRLRAALAVSGAAVAAGEVAYVHALTAHTHENFQHLWFSRTPGRLLGVLYDTWKLGVGGAARAAVVLLALAWVASMVVRRGPATADAPTRSAQQGEAAWLATACAFVLAAVYLGGVTVSLLFAPSLSDRNILTMAPATWVLLAAVWDAAMRRLGPRAGPAAAAAAAALLVVHGVAIGRGRGLQRNEPWRETARYVSTLPACRDAVLDVVQPDRFGPDTPFYREVAQRDLFGRYLGDSWRRVRPHLAGDFTDPGRAPDLARRLAQRASDRRSCPVLAWAVHDVDTAQALALRDGIARLPGVAPSSVRLRIFPHVHLQGDRWITQPSGYVVERAP